MRIQDDPQKLKKAGFKKLDVLFGELEAFTVLEISV
jgi:hypothetical protein